MPPRTTKPDPNDLGVKLDRLIRLTDESLHLQRVALLDEGHVLRFFHAGVQINMSIPDAQRDYIQRVILRNHGFYEAPLLRKFADLGIVGPDSTVYDVGANIGNHTVFFGRVLGARRIVAFEPQDHCHDVLVRNIALNGLLDVQTVQTLVGAAPGKGELAQHKPLNLGGARFTASDDGALPLTSLDAHAKQAGDERIDFIKIDVEGMQMAVLEGAKDILSAMKPALWIELIADADEFEPAADWLAAYGYAPERLGPSDVVFRVA